MFAGQFHPLLIIANHDDRHQDVLHLTDLLTRSEVKGGELYPLSALTDMNKLIP